MKWFKHDSDANRDVKLRKVKMKYGMEGYGLYWHIIEEIVNNVSIDNLTFELESDSIIIAHDTGISSELIQEMMVFMADLNLFEFTDARVISCLKIAKRLDQSMTSSPAFRKALQGIHEIIPSKSFVKNHDAVMTKSCLGHDKVMQEEKRKDKNRVGKRFVPPSIEDLKTYMQEKSISLDADDFIDFYESKGWMVGKNKMKNWKSAASRWARQNATTTTTTTTGAIHNAI